MKVCHCGAAFSFDRALKKPDPSDPNRKAWFCADCEGLAHTAQEASPVVRGPENARALLNAHLHEDGSRTLSWAVGPQGGKERRHVKTVEFYPYPRRVPMSEPEPLIFKTWELLMSKMPLVMHKPEDPWDGKAIEAQRTAKNEARGIAEVLAILMAPFMESADHVVRCAAKYYRDPTFEVPGLGLHLWDPLMNPDGTVRHPVAAPKSPSKPVAKPKPRVDNKSTKTLSDKEAEGIKEAVASGMFSKEDVAAMFKVSLATVDRAVSS